MNRPFGGPARWPRLVLALVVTGACTTPFEVSGLVAYRPAPVYRIWWDQVERCVGWRGDFDEIEWYTGRPVGPGGEELTGEWTEPRYIVLRPFYVSSEPAVKHEMLHHLSGGGLPHSDPAFASCTRPSERVRIVITRP